MVNVHRCSKMFAKTMFLLTKALPSLHSNVLMLRKCYKYLA